VKMNVFSICSNHDTWLHKINFIALRHVTSLFSVSKASSTRTVYRFNDKWSHAYSLKGVQ